MEVKDSDVFVAFQESTPVELPNMSMEPKQVKPQTPAPKGLGTSLGLSTAIRPAPEVKPQAEDIDEELDRLLSLQTPVSEPLEALPVSAAEEETDAIQDQRECSDVQVTCCVM